MILWGICSQGVLNPQSLWLIQFFLSLCIWVMFDCDLCICSNHLSEQDTLMIFRVGTDLWVQENIIRNQLFDFFFLARCTFFHPRFFSYLAPSSWPYNTMSGMSFLSWCGSQIRQVIGWQLPQALSYCSPTTCKYKRLYFRGFLAR